MRQKRAKAYKRLMSLYSQTFGFRQPFQVLVAHDFLLELANKQLDVSKQLTNCVQGECKPMITQCSVDALYKLGRDAQSVVDIAKTFERRRCNHREALPEHDCITEVVGPTNKHRYTMAIQSTRLRNNLRRIPGVPIIHFNERSVMVLEMPSDATLKQKDQLERTKLTAQSATHPIIDDVNVVTSTSTTGAGPSDPKVRSRKAGPKAPNPLSISKKESQKQTGRLSKKELDERAARAERKRVARERRDADEDEEHNSSGDGSDSQPRSTAAGKRKRVDDDASGESEGEEPDGKHAGQSGKPAQADESFKPGRDAKQSPREQSPEAITEQHKRKRKRKRKAGSAPEAEIEAKDDVESA